MFSKKSKIKNQKSNEKYVICDVRTPRNYYGKRLGNDYIASIYTGDNEKMDNGQVMIYGFGRKKDFNKAKKYNSKSYAENLARKINNDCELGGTGKWMSVVPLSHIGKKIDFER